MTGFDLSTIQNCYIGGAAASAIYLGSTKIWPSHDYSQDYFTIVSLEDNNDITFNTGNDGNTRTISISTDNGSTWTSYTSSVAGTLLANLNNGNKLLIKGNNTAYYSGYIYSHFYSSKTFNVEGNIMSLIYEDNFANQTSFPINSSYNFMSLFDGCKIVNAENLILPATSLTRGCYESMFEVCVYLTTPPVLPATQLGDYCYEAMFGGCTQLATAPALPATILTEGCYKGMFMGCTNLTIAPELPATTISSRCYASMFSGCKKLTTVQAILPATTLAVGCYYGMYSECQQLVNAPELPATTLQRQCYTEMFYWCLSLTDAPELPATTLVQECYLNMFNSCGSLQYVKCLATDISASSCITNWLSGVAASGTFVKDANTTWPSGGSGIPSSWTVTDAA